MELNSELVSGFIGAIIGGTATVIASTLSLRGSRLVLEKQLAHERELKNWEVQQERGEELYGLIEVWSKAIFSMHLPLYSVMKGEATYNEYLDLFNSYEFDKRYDPNRLEMLIPVYFPSLLPLWETARARLEQHNAVVSDHKDAYRNGATKSLLYVEKFQAVQISFEKAVSDLKEALANELRSNVSAKRENEKQA